MRNPKSSVTSADAHTAIGHLSPLVIQTGNTAAGIVMSKIWTDPDEKPSAAEIKRRQQEAEKSEDAVKLILKRIS